MSDKDKIDHLLLPYLLNELNEEERKNVDNWIRESDKNARYFEEFRKVHAGLRFAVQSETIRTSYKELHRKMRNRKIIRLSRRIAAAVILTFGLVSGSYFLYQSRSNQDLPLAESTIRPGRSQAVLHLSSGSSVHLEKKAQNLREQDGTEIQISQEGMLNYLQSDHTADKELFNRLEIPRGGEFKLSLSDGTEIWLNAESELEYPTTFSEDSRKVKLKGEAYFKVAKNPERPFIVEVGDIGVKVYGTEFNINTHTSDAIETVLVHGSISILHENRETLLKPSQLGRYNPAQKTLSVEKINTLPYTAWKEGFFVFHNETLGSIMEKLARWYDLNLFYTHEEVKSIRLSGVMERYKDVNELFRYFEKISAARFTTNGQTVMIK